MENKSRSVDDTHRFDHSYDLSTLRFKKSTDSAANLDLMNRFVLSCRRAGIRKSTILSYVNTAKRLLEHMQELGIQKDLHEIDQYDFDIILLLKQGTIRNYKKFVKKFYGWYVDENPLNATETELGNMRWYSRLKLESIDSTVQPHEVLTSEEIDRMLAVCSNNPRNKALIAVLADGGMRIGALGSCQIKHVQLNDTAAKIYISKTSKSKKTADARGIPLTWSTGYLEHWISMHPQKNNPEAPLWVLNNRSSSLSLDGKPMGYNTLRKALERIGAKAGVKKRVNPHAFRHYAIINWILDGLTEQEIKHRA
ncbi:tyrosine-type recombinase/integrase [Methanosalsum natronophilum]|uniref:tyrosine-type recombinase/integrase n=1 Tax=Methanosalsum natronophilum TaxID=768733 RepID=UPI002168214F|nr:site-specific integrase [Methanosalsum natronophilum]MCS3924392.1 integrase [Methanosalsum natronophilum]